MLQQILRYWWTYLVRGILALLFGVICLVSPGITLQILALWVGVFVLLDGLFGLIGTLVNWKGLEEKWLLILEAGIGILLGWLIIRMPEVTVLVLVLLMAVWAMLAGVTRIALAIHLRKEIKGEGWAILGGLLTVGMGVLLVLLPNVGVVTLAVIIGISALLVGGVLIAGGLRMRKLHSAIKDHRDRS
jgi:uncharacterized membrane protein HdeD (DUF308 family)